MAKVFEMINYHGHLKDYLLSPRSTNTSFIFFSSEAIFMNYLSFIGYMRISISSLRWIQSFIVWLCHLWKRQYLILSIVAFEVVTFGYLIPGSLKSVEAILTRISSQDTVRWVYSANWHIGPLTSRRGFPSFHFSRSDFLEYSTLLVRYQYTTSLHNCCRYFLLSWFRLENEIHPPPTSFFKSVPEWRTFSINNFFHHFVHSLDLHNYFVESLM
jgi:membrane-associated HD superfamily phosphohydrolase